MDQQHKYMFDEENLLNILINVGFRSVKLRSFDPFIDSKKEILNLFMQLRLNSIISIDIFN